ncbi:acetyl-CoA carboxylase biotin carboxyl carrier protein subunit [Oceanibacterium hippocampi]|uniref:Acetyl-/propionyl-coenzyme A carboxylase alpha chain n=1 Tax=Oceanibacterium hippocampi TaxID=745714 RepID=A0A1Y5SRA7_9PROT|nr:acetyl-CoA carboxylase biotin carboxyl carrier protein subunit [Oceanibacterium hippocampi]SLN46623.1 Acetyl-/propionyl-coenzyme A carboxylase alpha chain [Oceanibacterium hippocampi]
MVIQLRLDGADHELDIVSRTPELVVRLDGRLHRLGPAMPDGAGARLLVDDRQVAYEAAADGGAVYVRCAGRHFRVEIPDPRDAAGAGGGNADEIVAPMPGVVVRLARAAGDEVAAGDTVLTIESMKLQMNLTAQRGGRIARIVARQDQTFDKGDVLAVLESVEAAE